MPRPTVTSDRKNYSLGIFSSNETLAATALWLHLNIFLFCLPNKSMDPLVQAGGQYNYYVGRSV